MLSKISRIGKILRETTTSDTSELSLESAPPLNLPKPEAIPDMEEPDNSYPSENTPTIVESTLILEMEEPNKTFNGVKNNKIKGKSIRVELTIQAEDMEEALKQLLHIDLDTLIRADGSSFTSREKTKIKTALRAAISQLTTNPYAANPQLTYDGNQINLTTTLPTAKNLELFLNQKKWEPHPSHAIIANLILILDQPASLAEYKVADKLNWYRMKSTSGNTTEYIIARDFDTLDRLLLSTILTYAQRENKSDFCLRLGDFYEFLIKRSVMRIDKDKVQWKSKEEQLLNLLDRLQQLSEIKVQCTWGEGEGKKRKEFVVNLGSHIYGLVNIFTLEYFKRDIDKTEDIICKFSLGSWTRYTEHFTKQFTFVPKEYFQLEPYTGELLVRLIGYLSQHFRVNRKNNSICLRMRTICENIDYAGLKEAQESKYRNKKTRYKEKVLIQLEKLCNIGYKFLIVNIEDWEIIFGMDFTDFLGLSVKVDHVELKQLLTSNTEIIDVPSTPVTQTKSITSKPTKKVNTKKSAIPASPKSGTTSTKPPVKSSEESKQDLAEIIKAARISRKMSLRTLAKAITEQGVQVSYQNVRRWENAELIPNATALSLLKKLLNF